MVPSPDSQTPELLNHQDVISAARALLAPEMLEQLSGLVTRNCGTYLNRGDKWKARDVRRDQGAGAPINTCWITNPRERGPTHFSRGCKCDSGYGRGCGI